MTQSPASMPSLPDGSAAIAADLLATLCYGDTPYGWQPRAAELPPEAANPALDLVIDGAMEAAIATGWQQLSSQLDQQWQAIDGEALSSPWRESLIRRFQERLPADLLQTLITTAMNVTHSGESRLQQLVSCVGAALPDWDVEDLRVLARPLAYAFRSGQESQVLKASPGVDWQARSRVEQAKLGLAIAAILLDELQTPGSPQDSSIL
ncbi:MAG: hypothetical protein LVS60_18050 [Nodosilinea sp. LVE1205-7]